MPSLYCNLIPAYFLKSFIDLFYSLLFLKENAPSYDRKRNKTLLQQQRLFGRSSKNQADN